MELTRSRELLRVRIKKQLEEINQYFLDIEHWNRTRPLEKIEPDPDGKLATLKATLEATVI
jgi:hypothetical protein